MSAEGLLQGNPLSALLFCLAIQRLLNELAATLQVGYLDNVTLGGAANILAADVEHIKASVEKHGLILNISKCELIAQEPSKVAGFAAFKDFRLIKLEDMRLLEAPILNNRAMEAILKEKMHLLEKVILRKSLGISKMQYILRTANCADKPERTEFDITLRSGLVDILNVELTDIQWIQASLPVRSGGLGFQSAVTPAPSAFFASAVSTLGIQNVILTESAHISDDAEVVKATEAR